MTTYRQGFTLIEVLIVLTIIALVVAIGAPRLARSFGSPIKTVTRNMVMLTKQLHNTAKLKNKTFRIVIQFEDPEKKTGSQFFVESASHGQLIQMDADDKYKSKKDKEKEAESSPFTADASVMKRPISLPRGVKFSSVEIEDFEKPITEGKAYIHFFPQGLIQRSIIHLTDGKDRNISLIINPLTGRTDVEGSIVTLQDLNK